MYYGILMYDVTSNHLVPARHNLTKEGAYSLANALLAEGYKKSEVVPFRHMLPHEAEAPSCHACIAAVNEQIAIDDERRQHEINSGGSQAETTSSTT